MKDESNLLKQNVGVVFSNIKTEYRPGTGNH